jgi:glycosyltransferase involved in cell wall biosynthesis
MICTISFIVPAHNEEEVVKECLDALLAEEYQDKEIIVVNDGSTDCTREIIESYGNKLKLINFDTGHSAAFSRNAGAKVASGDLLVFIDADVIISGGFLNTLAQDYLEHNFMFAGINVKPLTTNIISRSFALEKSYFPKIEKKEFTDNFQNIPSFAFIFRKDFFEKIGGYNENTFYFEDSDLTKKCIETGNKMFLDPDLIVYHKEPYTLWETYRQGVYKGKGSVTLYKQGRANLSILLKNFFHPVAIAFIFPYLGIALTRTIKEYKDSGDLFTAIMSNFIVKPLKGIGAGYATIKYL